MPVSSDFSLDYTNRRLYHSSGTARYTVNELYSWLMDLFDDAAQMDNPVAASAQTPTEYSLINGWFMDDESFGYLYGGSIQTIGWNAGSYTDGIYRLTFQSGGYTNAVSGDIGKVVTDGTRTGVLLAYNNTLRKWWVRRVSGTAWSGSVTITGGTGAGTITGSPATGEDVWGNFYNLGTLKAGSVIYIEQANALVASPPGYTDGAMDVLVRVRENGTDIDSRKVTFFARNLGDVYSSFTAQASATGGRNPVVVETSTDLNDDSGTSSDGGITLTFGSTNKDIGDGAGLQPYGLVIDGNGLTTLQVYRALKYLTRRQSTVNMDGVQGRFYRWLNSAYAEVKNSPFGFYAGGKFFGARGVWLENISDPNNIELIDSNGVTRSPPVSFTVTVTNVLSGDRVLVARDDGAGGIRYDQFTLSGAHSGGTTITVNESIAADIPSAGVIRVGDTRYTYTARNPSTKQFTGVSPTVGSHPANSPAYVPLIDDVASGTTIASPSMQHVANFGVLARVRKKGIIPFEIPATVTSAGASISAIRTTDTIVT